MAEVICGAVSQLLELADQISNALNALQGFPEESKELKSRCQILSSCVAIMKDKGLDRKVLVQMQNFEITLQEALRFVQKLGKIRKTWFSNAKASVKRIARQTKYQSRFEAYNRTLDRQMHDFSFRLQILQCEQAIANNETSIPMDPIAMMTAPSDSKAPARPPSNASSSQSTFQDVDDEDLVVDIGDEENWPTADPGENFVVWDDKPPAKSTSSGSSSNSSRSVADRLEYLLDVERLCKLDQNAKITRVKLCMARLDPGDTSYGVLAAKTAGKVVGTVFGLGLSAMIVHLGAGLGAYEDLQNGKSPMSQDSHCRDLMRASFGALTYGPRFYDGKFTHYLLEIELADPESDFPTHCTLERCVEDVFLYEGFTRRHDKNYVFVSDKIEGMTLADLIAIRNVSRQDPYELFENDCRTFAFEVLRRLAGGPNSPLYCCDSEGMGITPLETSCGFVKCAELNYLYSRVWKFLPSKEAEKILELKKEEER